MLLRWASTEPSSSGKKPPSPQLFRRTPHAPSCLSVFGGSPPGGASLAHSVPYLGLTCVLPPQVAESLGLTEFLRKQEAHVRCGEPGLAEAEDGHQQKRGHEVGVRGGVPGDPPSPLCFDFRRRRWAPERRSAGLPASPSSELVASPLPRLQRRDWPGRRGPEEKPRPRPRPAQSLPPTAEARRSPPPAPRPPARVKRSWPWGRA